MRLSAHGIGVELPPGWEGRVFRRPEGDPTLHAANFPLPARDGDFGTTATKDMPRGGVFVVLTEYRPGQGLEPGQGLFAPDAIPLPLELWQFRRRALLLARPDQAGFQHFFSADARPFCLYAVLRHTQGSRLRAAAAAQRPVGALNRALASVAIAPHAT